MARSRRKASALSDEALELVAARFRVLGDPTRLRVLNLLMSGEASVQQIVERTGLEQPTVSRHLALLRREGVVERRSEGNRAFYTIKDATVVRLCQIVCRGIAGGLSDTLDALPDEGMWKGLGI